MAIITITRQLAALGDETAHELAKLLGYRFVDKATLEERIKSLGVSGQNLKKYDERKPTFWASLSQGRDDYLHHLKTAMYCEALEGNCILIGRGASIIFKNVPGVLSVFLVSPFEIRVERVKSYFHCDDKRAKQILDQTDSDRIGFHRYFFDIDWNDPANYLLTLNTGSLHPIICAQSIKQIMSHSFTTETDTLHKQRLKELTLGQQIKHHILYEKSVAIHFLEASVSNDIVTLYGVANSQALIESALTAARDMVSQDNVRSEIQMVQEYNIMP
ncbi:cytidylate kinase family protein [Breznakiellaceae bacterium SP9]